MTKTVYLGATLAALFAVSMMMTPSVIADDESGTHLDFDEVEIEIENDAVIICVGGILPSAFLKDTGVDVETKYGTA